MNSPTEPSSLITSPWPTWVADSVQMGLIVLDEQCCVCLFNKWMQESSGLVATQVLGKNLFDVFPELSVGRVNLAIKSCFDTGLPALLSNSLNPEPFPIFSDARQKALGVRRQQSVRIMRSPRLPGAATQVLIEVTDVTAAVRRERKLQELNATLTRSHAATQAALRDNEALLTTINLYAIVSVTDRHGVITDVNDAFCSISGYTREELLGQNHRILNSGAQPREFWQEMWQFISQGRPWRSEVCNRAKNGSLFWVDTFISPFVGDDGGIDRFISIRVDITANKHAERELLRATEAAQEASRSKSQFLANMSHEIRTPMNAILGMLRLLHSTDLTPRQLDYTSKSEGAAKSLLGLLNDILDFSKIDAGKMTLDPQPFRVDRLLRDLSVILAANVGQKPVEVLFDIDPATPKILVGDTLRLQQVLINLSGNAIKFTAQGEVVIQVQVLAVSGVDYTLKISVRDSGIGIAPEHQSQIFDGFSQAEASTTRRFGGTGLGLSISRHLVAMMGGELCLDSVLGQGSAFYFTITLPCGAQVPDDRAPPPQRLGAKLSVLVIDDNAIARDLLTKMAQSWHWQVDAVSGGGQALAQIEKRRTAGLAPYQLVLVDWHMPQMDGWETMARISAQGAEQPPPLFIMVTGQGREMLAQRSAPEQARLSAFLVKPITASMLFDAVSDALAGLSNLRVRPRVKSQAAARLQGMHVLLVEDNQINQQVAEELLRAEGASVEIADNGQLALQAIATTARPFDAVLMDVQMPVMDGYTATRILRQEMGQTALPVIAMTANAMASDRAACLDAGMNDHVGKPFDLTHLVEVLRKFVLARAANQPTGTKPQNSTLPATSVPAGALDIETAVARLGGNVDLYGSILQTFVADLARLPDQLATFLRAGDFSGANRLLHTVKGVSATIGATHLARVLQTLERVLGQSPRDPGHEAGDAALLASLCEAIASSTPHIQQTIEELVTPRRASPKADPVSSTTRKVLLADLRQLQALLQQSDMAALGLYHQLCSRHAENPLISLEPLHHPLSTLDFAQGALQCEQLIQLLAAGARTH